jgi:hypothetical protein
VQQKQTTQRDVKLPIGRTAKLVFDIDVLREECSRAAQVMLSQNPMDSIEFEECARLDDALAQAQNGLKQNLRRIMLSRIRRHSRPEKAK